MPGNDAEERALRSSALRNAGAILVVGRRAEEALVQTKEVLEARTQELSHTLSLMRATLESTADGILVTSGDGHVVTFNEQFLELWGLERAAVEGATHADLIRAVAHRFRDPQELESRISAIYAAAPAQVVDTLVLADGRVLERHARPQFVDASVVGHVWSYRDVTARRKVEDAVRDEARMLDLLNHTGAMISSTLDLSVLLQTVTDAATQLSGAEFGAFFYNTTDASGDAYRLYALSGAPREAFEKFGQPRATPLFGPTFSGEATVRCDDVLADPRYGHWAPHHGLPRGHLPVRSFLAVPVAARSGEAVGGLFFGHAEVGVFSARTERLVVGIAAQASVAIDNARLYEETRRVAAERERLVESERAARLEMARVGDLKDEFLATLSHELRTPLTAILGWAKVLARKHDDPQTLERGLDAIHRNAVAQARLIDDLLDMNRIVSGKVRLDVQPTDLAHAIEVAVEAVRPSAEAKEIRLHTVVDPHAGPVSGDPNRLQQVLWNLLTNAVKFTPKRGRIEVVLQRVDTHMELTVADSGIGIAADFLPLVFDRFRQADSSITRRHGGLGIGLSIVKQLVELHGGTVQAKSDGPGQGAAFLVRLPLAALRATAGREPSAVHAVDAPASEATVDLRGLRVLVVDDEPDARELIGQLLREHGAQVDVAASAAEALLALQRIRPDLLLSDIGLPGRDGYQLMREVRALAPEQGGRTPAIALTAFARSEDRACALLAGYQMHVSKPIEVHELLAAVASLGRNGPIEGEPPGATM